MKFNSDHNSCRLFCSGVPVMRSRPLLTKVRMIWLNRESTFLMRCASSMMMYSQLNFFRVDFSRKHISYEVMRMSKSWVRTRLLMSSSYKLFSLVFPRNRIPYSVLLGSLQNECLEPWHPLRHFPRPVVQSRFGHDDEMWSGRSLMEFEASEERDGLQRLAQALSSQERNVQHKGVNITADGIPSHLQEYR